MDQPITNEDIQKPMTIEEFSRHMKDNEKFSQPYKKISSATPEEIREWCDWTGSFTCGWGIF